MIDTRTLHGYLGFYNGRQVEIQAESLLDAKTQAINRFKPPKSKRHMVHVYLAEKDGKEVLHTPDF